jgi:hypothetical protein
MFPGQIWVSSPKRYPEQHKSWYWLAYQDCGGLYQAPSGKKKNGLLENPAFVSGIFPSVPMDIPLQKTSIYFGDMAMTRPGGVHGFSGHLSRDELGQVVVQSWRFP